MQIEITPGQLGLADLRAARAGGVRLTLNGSAEAPIAASAAAVQAAAAGDVAIYGVNTGFGKLASQRISKAELASLQCNLIRSHCVGVGAPLPPSVVRLMLLCKSASLARGYSGVRRSTIECLLQVFNSGLIPYVPCQGSVGASGDLAPLSHMTLALMGEGEMLVDGERRPARVELERAGIAPLVLEAKEGLALINGTQTSTALALDALFRFETVFASAVLSGALSLDAARGSDGPFDPRIHAVRGQPGQIETAQAYRQILAGSEIRLSHREGDDRVQDPYSLRCQPQVMGACLDQARHVRDVLLREANAVTDNPLVFSEADGSAVLLSGGNFHAEPVALVAEPLYLPPLPLPALSPSGWPTQGRAEPFQLCPAPVQPLSTPNRAHIKPIPSPYLSTLFSLSFSTLPSPPLPPFPSLSLTFPPSPSPPSLSPHPRLHPRALHLHAR